MYSMFSIGFLTLDLIIIIAIAVACFFVSLIKGEYILARILVSFYPATLIYTYLPYFSPKTAISQIITYFIVFFACYFLLKKNISTGRSYSNGKKFFDAVILAIATVLTLMTIYYHIIPLDTVREFSLPFSQYLTSIIPFGVWLAVPIIALVITNKHSS